MSTTLRSENPFLKLSTHLPTTLRSANPFRIPSTVQLDNPFLTPTARPQPVKTSTVPPTTQRSQNPFLGLTRPVRRTPKQTSLSNLSNTVLPDNPFLRQVSPNLPTTARRPGNPFLTSSIRTEPTDLQLPAMNNTKGDRQGRKRPNTEMCPPRNIRRKLNDGSVLIV